MPADDPERTWAVRYSCGHVQRHTTVIGDFDYPGLLREQEFHLCGVCRYDEGKPIEESFHGLVSVQLVPNDLREEP